LQGIAKDYKHEWKYYNKKYGWSYRVADKKKPLFYVTPLKNSFHLGFSLQKAEKKTLEAELDNEAMTREIRKAKEFPEGFAVQFTITEKKMFDAVLAVIENVILVRN
jgi:hypothetical protein